MNNFRRMWAAAPDAESHSLIREAEEAVTRSVSRISNSCRIRTLTISHLQRQTSPPLANYGEEDSQAPGQRQIYRVLKQRLWSLISVCRRCTTDCVQTCRQILDTVVDILRSSVAGFGADKRHGLHTDL